MFSLLKILLLFHVLLLPVISFAEDNSALHNLTVRFDLENHTLRGDSQISLQSGQTATIDISGLKIISALINERALIIEPGIDTIRFSPVTPNDILKIEYEAEFKTTPETDRGKNPGVVHGNIISADGIILTNGWYPSIDGLSVYNLTAILPNEFEGISEAEEITIREKTDISREFTFIFRHPLRDINLIAGKYVVERDRHNETDLFAYFLPEDKELAKTYIEYTKKYLVMYKKLVGSYPFKRFSVVENILPTGYAMPTFTLLGKDVVRLPFIVETSLGHEILHQWFGNLVYTDYKSGNWSEGLTTYLADHMYEEIKGAGWDYRKQALISFQSYVTLANDFPLKDFTVRTDRASGAVGYAKSAMVFHMLKNLVGEEVFYHSLRILIEKNRFNTASWNEVRDAFEFASGKDLNWFFKQWVEEKGVPEIEVQNINLKFRGSKAIVSFEVNQKGNKYRIPIPVLLRSKNAETRKTFELSKESETFEIETDGSPLELVIDENYDLFRKLSDRESPPVISRLLGSDKKIFVIPLGKAGEYSLLIEVLKEEGFTDKEEEEITYEDIKSSSLIIPGAETGLVRRLFGKVEMQKDDFQLVAKENPFNNKGVITIIDSPSVPEITRYFQKVTHYGKYSRISFKDGKNTLKMTDNTDRGIRSEVVEDIVGIEVPKIINISGVIEKMSGKKIIYVGEGHDKFEHHRVQLEIIRSLHGKDKNLAIGMEMFQKPFQKALDDYIAGLIDEKEFLKKSEYFKRWGFDYNLYREILMYAKDNKIPVIALNVRKEIVSKVAKEGIHSLTEEEIKEVPEDMDLSDTEYMTRLRGYFERHKNPEDRNFDFFYQAQVLWDESMAHNLNEFIQKNPEYQIVVIAGVGHMAFGSGIPKRAFRLNNKEYSVVLNDDSIENNIADFVLLPPAVRPPESPKLMVVLKEEEGKIKIADFAPESISEKAGLNKEDIILSLDDTKVETIDDIKIFLLYKNKGDEINVKVLRERFLFGLTEMEFKIKL